MKTKKKVIIGCIIILIIVLVVNFKYFIDTNHHVKHLNTHISKLSESHKQLNDKYKNTSYKLNKMKEYNNTTALNIIKSTENIARIEKHYK